MVGADLQLGAQRYQRQRLIGVLLVNDRQRPLTQRGAALAQVGDKADTALPFLGGVQRLGGFAVALIQLRQLAHRPTDAHTAAQPQRAVRQLAEFVCQNVQVLLKIRGVSHEQRHQTARRIKRIAA